MTNSLTSAQAATIRFPWMFSRSYDVFFFFVSFLFGLAVYQLSTASFLAQSIFFTAFVTTAFGAGPFHQGPTWFTYLDAKNREWYRSNRLKLAIFWAGPPLIMLISIAGMVLCKPLIMGIWLLWSIQHLVQQNVGILLLYHNHNQGEAIVERTLEAKSLQVSAAFFTLIMVRRLFVKMPGFNAFDGFICVVGLAAFVLMALYVVRLRVKVAAGESLNVPALCFWLLSFFSLCPMAFLGKDFPSAFLAPVTWHWFQYIGLNYRLVRNKYADERRADLPAPQPVFIFFALCIGLVVLNLSLSVWAQSVNPETATLLGTMLFGAVIGLGNVHYFLDAFIWRFREPYPRQSILPYLKTRTN